MLGIELKSVHYGAFEKLGPVYKAKDIPIANRIAPIIDMTEIVRLQQFTETANSLTQFGRMQRIGEDILNHITENDNRKAISSLVDAVKELDDAIQISRLLVLKKGKYKKQINDSVRVISRSQLPLPIKQIFSRLVDKELVEFKPEDSFDNVIAAFNWAMKYDMLPQAATIARESILVLTAERFQARNPYEGKPSEKRSRMKRLMKGILLISEEDVVNGIFREELAVQSDLVKELLQDEKIKNLRVTFKTLRGIRDHIKHDNPSDNFLTKVEDLFVEFILSEKQLAISQEIKDVNYREFIGSLLGISDRDMETESYCSYLAEYPDLAREMLKEDLILRLRESYKALFIARNKINDGLNGNTKEELKESLGKSFRACLSILNQVEEGHGN